jgi:hypothetical protein
MSSRRFTETPWPLEASMISPVRRSAIECSLRARELLTSQRSASVVPRVGRTSTGTW